MFYKNVSMVLKQSPHAIPLFMFYRAVDCEGCWSCTVV